VKRKMIEIDEEKCDGCGNCIPGCPEGALQIIDGKARLVSALLCDGLGACVGECPKGALKVVEREAEKYDEVKVMENIIKQGENTVNAHLKHLRDHGQTTYYKQALAFLREKNMEIKMSEEKMVCGCPGSMMRDFSGKEEKTDEESHAVPVQSALRQWPVQLHLISPAAPYFTGADLLVAADCTAYALGDFHSKYLKGKSLIVACPKLDKGIEIYIDKIRVLIDESKVNTITILRMEVPCCSGIISIVREAASKARRKVPVKEIVVGIRGNILSEEWL